MDCCSTSATVTLSAVQDSDRLLFYPVLQWHCLLCRTGMDCCSTGATVALSDVQDSDRLLFYLSS
jgi:hypothetical protein